MDHGVHGIGPLHRQDALLTLQGGGVLLRQTQSGCDAQIHQPLLVEIQVGGVFHIRGRGPQACQKAHRKGREDQQGEKAAAGVPNLPQSVRHNAVMSQLHTIHPPLGARSDEIGDRSY